MLPIADTNKQFDCDLLSPSVYYLAEKEAIIYENIDFTNVREIQYDYKTQECKERIYKNCKFGNSDFYNSPFDGTFVSIINCGITYDHFYGLLKNTDPYSLTFLNLQDNLLDHQSPLLLEIFGQVSDSIAATLDLRGNPCGGKQECSCTIEQINFIRNHYRKMIFR